MKIIAIIYTEIEGEKITIRENAEGIEIQVPEMLSTQALKEAFEALSMKPVQIVQQ